MWRILLCCLGIHDKRQVILRWLAFNSKISNVEYREIGRKREKPGRTTREQTNAFVRSRGWSAPSRIRSKGHKAKDIKLSFQVQNEHMEIVFTMCLRRLWMSIFTWLKKDWMATWKQNPLRDVKYTDNTSELGNSRPAIFCCTPVHFPCSSTIFTLSSTGSLRNEMSD